jgi:hypothetical protein
METIMRFTPTALGLAALLGCGTLLAGAQQTTAAAQASPACSVAYQVDSQWATGFDLSITITNSASLITAWTLQYAYSGNQQLTDGWDGDWSQSGDAVTVTNASWNGTLATGASTTIGAIFSYSGSNAAPSAFSLNGVACNGSGGTGTAGTQPTVSITSPAPGTEASGSTVTITASASPGSSGTVSSVTFYAADYCTGTSAELGSAAAAPYAVQWAEVPAGNFGVSAVVTTSQDVSVMSAAVELTTTSQGQPSSCPVPAGDPTIAIVSPQQGTTVNSNVTVPVSAVTSVGSGGSISSVSFYAVDTCGSTTTLDLGTVSAAPYTYQWVQPTPGIYTLTAVADDGGMSLTSSQVQIYAGPDGVPPPCPTVPPSPAPAG